MRPVLTAFFTALLGSFAHADTWAEPSPRLFASDIGPVAYGFKVLPTSPTFETSATGELFRLAPDGMTPTVWRGMLRNLPLNAYITPRGQVVTVDTYAGDRQGRHALVIYDPKGKVLADLTYAEVVRGKVEHPRFQVGGISGPFLSQAYAVKFTYESKLLLAFKDAQGRGPVFNPETGKRVR